MNEGPRKSEVSSIICLNDNEQSVVHDQCVDEEDVDTASIGNLNNISFDLDCALRE